MRFVVPAAAVEYHFAQFVPRQSGEWQFAGTDGIGGGGGDSGEVGASLGRVLLMASLRFGQSKEHVPADGTRAVKGIFALQLMAPFLEPLIAVAVGTAIDEAVVVTLFVAYQVLLTGFAAELGMRVVVVLIGTAVVGAVVISVFVSVLITEFVVLVEIRRRFLARGFLFLGRFFLFARFLLGFSLGGDGC